jgi:predicted RNA-binding Zn-ribbon protein involved in translation (DUF1610 family)
MARGAVSSIPRETIMHNDLIRSQPCPQCGADVIWTQNAWKVNGTSSAAYVCSEGHAIDPALTRQCPTCGVHDTILVSEEEGRQQFRCARCGASFAHPR